MHRGKLNMSTARPLGKNIFSKQQPEQSNSVRRPAFHREGELLPQRDNGLPQLPQPPRRDESDEAPLDVEDSRVEEMRSNLRNFKLDDEEEPRKPRGRQKKQVEYEEDGGEYEEKVEKKQRKESLWMMFQKEMRQTPEVQALPGKDRLAYITMKWKEYKESTPKEEQEDHAIKFRAKQMVSVRMKQRKEEAEMRKYQEYLDSVAAQMEDDVEQQGGEAYSNVFKVGKKKA